MIRVYIVEDESILRQAIISVINWKSLSCEVVGSSENPIETLDFLKNNNVDLIISDIKMPKMDGLEFSELLSKQYPQISIILLTAFRSFEFVQRAIQFNVVSYVLKADFVNDLPKAVRDNFVLINQRKSAHIDNNILNDDDMRHLFIKNVCDGSIIDKSLISKWFLNHNLLLENYFVVVAEADIVAYSNFQESNYLANTAIENFLNLSFQEIDHIVVPISQNQIVNILSFQDTSYNENLSRVINVCNQIVATVEKYMYFEINLSISNMHHNFSEIKDAYNESIAALGKIFTNSSVSICDSSKPELEFKDSLNLYYYLEKMIRTILNNNSGELKAVIDELFLDFEKANYVHDTIKFQLIDFIALCMLNISQQSFLIEDKQKIQSEFIIKVIPSTSVFALRQLFENAILKIINNHSVAISSYSPIVEKANEYMMTNYNKLITLNEIARNCNISNSYLSRLYKKETGESIIRHLNYLRIEKAKTLLLNDYRISEVANQVGYDDPAYFTNVFSKYTGQSPKKFIQSNRT
ncbi:MAG: response regulator [Eubacteriales bacterium]